MFLVFLWKMMKFLFSDSLQRINWEHHPKLRKYYIHEVVRNMHLLGKSKSEIESLFGIDESGKHLTCSWSYYIETRKKMKYYLIFDFKDDQVIKVRYKFKKKYH
ncbi:hypothetical protein [Chryseobacterium sp. sg2396]|uniref:hypothetical protein n=1 Tax=Chryseobacterium sp. sg2396 TaxID=3276280 RepID=UPI0025D63236|nr:hypothetical protein [uncultured Chryseobacterium sp.]